MEKYGVEYDDEKVKTGSAGSSESCPGCGAAITAHRESYPPKPWCPNCGTEPFEKAPPQSKK